MNNYYFLLIKKKGNFQKFKTEGLAYFNTVFFLTQNYSEDFLSNTLPQQIHSPQKEAAFKVKDTSNSAIQHFGFQRQNFQILSLKNK